MDESKFANLDQEQLQELNELEAKLGVTLVAYEMSESFNSMTNEMPNA
jgi:hypothetical protein